MLWEMLIPGKAQRLAALCAEALPGATADHSIAANLPPAKYATRSHPAFEP
ncbi:MAG: hypothetical protein ACK2T3_02795 [Candidatus Promineifilaceae bacterium]|jgi:hypothetical protein